MKTILVVGGAAIVLWLVSRHMAVKNVCSCAKSPVQISPSHALICHATASAGCGSPLLPVRIAQAPVMPIPMPKPVQQPVLLPPITATPVPVIKPVTIQAKIPDRFPPVRVGAVSCEPLIRLGVKEVLPLC